MLGFLAAIVTLLFAINSSKAFKRYKKQGYLDVFFPLYFFTVFSLMMTFCLAMLGFAKQGSKGIFEAMMMSATNNMCQLFLITAIILVLAKRASAEP